MISVLILLTVFVAMALGGPPEDADARAILEKERAAFERWAKGDWNAFVEASDEEVTYFDPMVEKRLDGRAALKALYAPLQGQAPVEMWEMIDPKVVVAGDMGVLTFNFVSTSKGKTERWNTTEVYRRVRGQWKIVHTHWSLVKPALK